MQGDFGDEEIGETRGASNLGNLMLPAAICLLPLSVGSTGDGLIGD